MTAEFWREDSAGSLVYTRKRRQFVVNLGVVIITVEQRGACALCINRYGKSRVRIGSKVYARLVVKDMGDCNGKRLIAAIKHILFLCGYLFAAHSLVVCCFQLVVLIFGEDKVGFFRSVLVVCRHKPEKLLNVFQHHIERGLVCLVLRYIIAVELRVGKLLILKIGEICVVVCSRIADGKTACFVVACYDDKCFIGMFVVEFKCLFYAVGKRRGIGNRGLCIGVFSFAVFLVAFSYNDILRQ